MAKKLALASAIVVALVAAEAALAAGEWKQVGKTGDWKMTIAGVALGGNLYTAESSGALYVTDPQTGQWKQLGKKEFGNTRFMFTDGKQLYTIETDGSLYLVSPKDGSWKPVGKKGDWVKTTAGAVIGGKLYTTESSGILYETDLSSGQWKQIGKPEFKNTAFMFTDGSSLFTIETDGSLYAVNPKDGSWKQLGKKGDWKATLGGAVSGGKFYSAESGGGLYETDLGSGQWKQLGKPEFGNTRFMFACGGFIYTIEKDGSLYQVAIK